MVLPPKNSEPWEELPPHTSGVYPINASARQFMRIEVPEFGHVQFLAYQSAPRQTGSPRLSVLKERIYGDPLEFARKDWVALYNATMWFRLEDSRNQPNTEATQPITWSVAPGAYYISLQNMENSLNSWTIQFDGVPTGHTTGLSETVFSSLALGTATGRLIGSSTLTISGQAN